MATKEDILEQLVEEWLLHEGYFVRHNLKFRPSSDHPEFDSKKDSNHSDIDVIGYHPHKAGADRVKVISCKSWQGGFNPRSQLEGLEKDRIAGGREAWKRFRELVKPKWSEAFINAIESATGQKQFTYVLAVTRVDGDKSLWEKNDAFKLALNGNPLQIVALREMLDAIYPSLGTTLAGTEVGRILQLFKATGIKI